MNCIENNKQYSAECRLYEGKRMGWVSGLLWRSFPLSGRGNSATVMGQKVGVPAEMLERDVAGVGQFHWMTQNQSAKDEKKSSTANSGQS